MLPSASVWLDGGIGNRQSYYQKAIQFANSRFGPQFGRGAASGVSSNGCVGNKGVGVAPQVGLEPTTLRLTEGRLDRRGLAMPCYNLLHINCLHGCSAGRPSA